MSEERRRAAGSGARPDGRTAAPEAPGPRMKPAKTLYLANPYGFSEGQRAGPLAELVRALEALGAEVWEPFARNNQVDRAAPGWAYRIGQADLRDVRDADGIFAVVNGCPPDEGGDGGTRDGDRLAETGVPVPRRFPPFDRQRGVTRSTSCCSPGCRRPGGRTSWYRSIEEIADPAKALVTLAARGTGLMRLGLDLGYLTKDSPDPVALAERAEAVGFDSVWVSEAWGSDGVSVLAWIGARTERITLGTAILPIGSRTPALLAQTAATLDSPERRKGDPRPRRFRSAGHGGLARRPLREAGEADPRDCRGPPAHPSPGAEAGVRRGVHPAAHAGRHRTRKAAEADAAAAARRDSDLRRLDRSAEHRAHRGDRGRVAAVPVLAGPGCRSMGLRARRRRRKTRPSRTD